MPNRRRHVYIVNDSGHDFSAARKYGQLIYMTKGILNKYNLTAMRRTFEAVLKHSAPGDYLLHSGPSVMNALACAMFAHLHGRLNLLLYRADAEGDDHYEARKIVLGDSEQ